MKSTVAALFVEPGGVYYGLKDVDPWGPPRDAREYPGPHPVVAHPPCSAWCRMAPVNAARYGHAIGDDGGCFGAALEAVATWGGVLEHPAGSLAWAAYGLTRPQRGAWTRGLADHGWVTEVSQRAYGHAARKATWLYVIGPPPPPVDWSSPEPEAWVSWMANHGDSGLRRIGKREAARTPEAFRDLLLAIARRSGPVLAPLDDDLVDEGSQSRQERQQRYAPQRPPHEPGA